jgi:hypothetical protein
MQDNCGGRRRLWGGVEMLHRTRHLLVRQQTAVINSI